MIPEEETLERIRSTLRRGVCRAVIRVREAARVSFVGVMIGAVALGGGCGGPESGTQVPVDEAARKEMEDGMRKHMSKAPQFDQKKGTSVR